jgi:hypothetical protein
MDPPAHWASKYSACKTSKKPRQPRGARRENHAARRPEPTSISDNEDPPAHPILSRALQVDEQRKLFDIRRQIGVLIITAAQACDEGRCTPEAIFPIIDTCASQRSEATLEEVGTLINWLIMTDVTKDQAIYDARSALHLMYVKAVVL